jgi:hypothetical protein
MSNNIVTGRQLRAARGVSPRSNWRRATAFTKSAECYWDSSTAYWIECRDAKPTSQTIKRRAASLVAEGDSRRAVAEPSVSSTEMPRHH